MKKFILMLIVTGCALNLSGCVSSIILTQFRQNSVAEYQEVQPVEEFKSISATKLELNAIDNEDYQSYCLNDYLYNPNSCLELSLPTNIDFDKPQKVYIFENQQDNNSANTVSVLLLDSKYSTERYKEELLTILDSDAARESDLILNLIPGDSSFRLSSFQRPEEKWKRYVYVQDVDIAYYQRSYIKTAAYYAGYPFTFAFDFLTFPIQFMMLPIH